jgi:hypothetical protein
MTRKGKALMAPMETTKTGVGGGFCGYPKIRTRSPNTREEYAQKLSQNPDKIPEHKRRICTKVKSKSQMT